MINKDPERHMLTSWTTVHSTPRERQNCSSANKGFEAAGVSALSEPKRKVTDLSQFS